MDARRRRLDLDAGLLRWADGLPRVLETDTQVFVHAGIDEEAGDLWRWDADEATLPAKYPPTFGTFEKGVVSGYVGTGELAGGGGFHGVLHDGVSHCFIDGTTERSGVIPILRFDLSANRYAVLRATADAVSLDDVRTMPELASGSCGGDIWW